MSWTGEQEQNKNEIQKQAVELTLEGQRLLKKKNLMFVTDCLLSAAFAELKRLQYGDFQFSSTTIKCHTLKT